MKYVAPWWLPGGHLQTIWPAVASRSNLHWKPQYKRERWTTPDGDYIALDWQRVTAHEGAESPTLLVLFHGLEGSSNSHYAKAFAEQAYCRGWDYVVPHFRGCGGEINLAPRAYHSGDYEEVDWILRQLKTHYPAQRIVAVGVSLGGNALLRWAQEAGAAAGTVVRSLSAVSAPLDLAAGGYALQHGFNKWVYTRMFLQTMKPKAFQKLAQHPGLFDAEAVLGAKDLYAFDNAFTAPLHGFRDVDDYWKRASSKPHLHRIQVPALVINALNDPFVPHYSLPIQKEVGTWVQLVQPAQGGHVGFAAGRPPGHVLAMPLAVCDWLASH